MSWYDDDFFWVAIRVIGGVLIITILAVVTTKIELYFFPDDAVTSVTCIQPDIGTKACHAQCEYIDNKRINK